MAKDKKGLRGKQLGSRIVHARQALLGNRELTLVGNAALLNMRRKGRYNETVEVCLAVGFVLQTYIEIAKVKGYRTFPEVSAQNSKTPAQSINFAIVIAQNGMNRYPYLSERFQGKGSHKIASVNNSLYAGSIGRLQSLAKLG